MKTAFERINIITGHYGSGKTNLSVNLALMFARQGRKVCLVDFDIVNPYFRAEDSRALLERSGVRVISSIYANSNLDIPAVPGEINSVFDDKSYTVLLDVGGDDAGAAALGQFSAIIKSAGDYRHFYVFNARRPLTQTPQQAVDILREIERASRIPADALVNNTNLAIETDAAVIGDSAAYARAVSSLSGLPLAFTCVREGLESSCCGEMLPVQIFVNAPWNESPQNIE